MITTVFTKVTTYTHARTHTVCRKVHKLQYKKFPTSSYSYLPYDGVSPFSYWITTTLTSFTSAFYTYNKQL